MSAIYALLIGQLIRIYASDKQHDKHHDINSDSAVK